MTVVHPDGSKTKIPARLPVQNDPYDGHPLDLTCFPEDMRPQSEDARNSPPILAYHIIEPHGSWCYVFINYRRRLSHIAHLMLHEPSSREFIQFVPFIVNDSHLPLEQRFRRWQPSDSHLQQFELIHSFFSDQLLFYDPEAEDGGLSNDKNSFYLPHESGFYGGGDCTLSILQALPNFWNEAKILARIMKQGSSLIFVSFLL